MKLTVNGTLDYRGMGDYGPHSRCKLQVWTDGTKNVVLFTDLGVGTSVTNASEYIAEKVKQTIPLLGTTRWFETYDGEQVDEIEYRSKEPFGSPSWKPCPNFWDLVG